VTSEQIEVQMRHDHHYVSELHKRQKYDSEIESDRRDSKARRERRTVPITQGREAKEIREVLVDGPRSGDDEKE